MDLSGGNRSLPSNRIKKHDCTPFRIPRMTERTAAYRSHFWRGYSGEQSAVFKLTTETAQSSAENAKHPDALRESTVPLANPGRRSEAGRGRAERKRSGASFRVSRPHQNEAQRSGFVLKRKKEGADTQLPRHLRKPRKRSGASFRVSRPHQNEAQRSGFVLKRKKEGADTQLPRHLRKPRKRSGASFF